jgi:thiol-disulfide isomerase/thioredoxin
MESAMVVNFWATWCVPCREEMPEFVKAQSELGDRGVHFVGIAIDQPDKVDAFATELHLNYPALIGGFGAIELSKVMGNRLGALPSPSSSIAPAGLPIRSWVR